MLDTMRWTRGVLSVNTYIQDEPDDAVDFFRNTSAKQMNGSDTKDYGNKMKVAFMIAGQLRLWDTNGRVQIDSFRARHPEVTVHVYMLINDAAENEAAYAHLRDDSTRVKVRLYETPPKFRRENWDPELTDLANFSMAIVANHRDCFQMICDSGEHHDLVIRYRSDFVSLTSLPLIADADESSLYLAVPNEGDDVFQYTYKGIPYVQHNVVMGSQTVMGRVFNTFEPEADLVPHQSHLVSEIMFVEHLKKHLSDVRLRPFVFQVALDPRRWG